MLDKYSLFLGCIVPNRYPGIESATKMVFKKLNVDLKDLPGASCCPAPGVVGSFNEETWMAIAARNISISEKNGTDLINICNGCFGTLFEVNYLLKSDPEVKKRVNEILSEVDLKVEGSIEVHHFAKLLYDKYLEKITNLGKTRLKKLKVAVHYGCHLLRPTKIKETDNPEKPNFVDIIVEKLGATSVDYKEKNMCCGAGGGVRSSNLNVALDMTKEKLDNVKTSGADCIVNVCSFCHLQFDRGQIELKEKMGLDYQIPVIHLTQLLGLAFGLHPDKLGLRSHSISTDPFLQKFKR